MHPVLLIFAAMGLAIAWKMSGKPIRLPLPPVAPIDWVLNHRILIAMAMAKRFGDIFLLRMGVNLVVVSTPEIAREVLHTRKFDSRARNVAFDISTCKPQDMVFTVYGDHWRKMRRIMTVPFFTDEVVAQNRAGWEKEAQLVVEDVRRDQAAATKGVVIRRRLQLMMYNDMFRIMFDRWFESEDDPLFNELKALKAEESGFHFIPIDLRHNRQLNTPRMTLIPTPRMNPIPRMRMAPRMNPIPRMTPTPTPTPTPRTRMAPRTTPTPRMTPIMRMIPRMIPTPRMTRRMKLLEDHFVQERKKLMAQLRSGAPWTTSSRPRGRARSTTTTSSTSSRTSTWQVLLVMPIRVKMTPPMP